MEERKRIDVLLNGLIKENPVLVLVIGTCPTLATSTSVETGFGMGLAATAVLVCSNIVISALHNIIPDKVRIPCFITSSRSCRCCCRHLSLPFTRHLDCICP